MIVVHHLGNFHSHVNEAFASVVMARLADTGADPVKVSRDIHAIAAPALSVGDGLNVLK